MIELNLRNANTSIIQTTVEPLYIYMLYSGHLVIADTFSRNGPNHGQTLIEIPLYSGQFYSGHIFSEPREHLP